MRLERQPKYFNNKDYDAVLAQLQNTAYKIHVRDFPYECKKHGVQRFYTSTGRCMKCESTKRSRR